MLNTKQAVIQLIMECIHRLTVNPCNPLCVMISLWVKPRVNSYIPTDLFRMNVPSGASLRALPDISRSPTSHTYPEPVMLRKRAALYTAAASSSLKFDKRCFCVWKKDILCSFLGVIVAVWDWCMPNWLQQITRGVDSSHVNWTESASIWTHSPKNMISAFSKIRQEIHWHDLDINCNWTLRTTAGSSRGFKLN